jgi:septum formation protein
MSNTRQLILGSTSKPRQELLQRLQIPFQVVPSEVDETPFRDETPTQLVMRLAEAKAKAVAKKHPDAIVIGADQVGVLGNNIQGKPHTYEGAVKQLQEASGKRQSFLIGLCVLDARTNKAVTVLEKFDVVYRSLTQVMIENYLQKEQPYDCAGSCKGDGLGVALIEEFDGKDFTALIGLPLIRLVKMLESAGIAPV